MSILARARVVLEGDTVALTNAIQGASKAMEQAGARMTSVGRSMTLKVTTPIIAAGGAALKMGQDFNRAMANVEALMPGNTARVRELGSAVQDMAKDIGTSTTDLTGGLYQVVSAFGDTADTMGVLEINARSAKAGLATVTEAIDLTSGVTKAYGDTSLGAVGKVSDLAQLTVRLGQTTFPELAASIGRVTPLTAALNVSQEELFGTMATFTGVTGGAAEVSTQLRGVLQALMAPTADMSNLFSELGVESGAALVEQKGLQGAITEITEAARRTGQPLQKFIGSIEGQTLALAATGGQSDTYTQKLLEMESAAGATDAAFRAQTEGINASGFAMDKAKQEIIVSMQQIGDVILPMAAKIADVVAGVIGHFNGMSPAMQKVVVGGSLVVAAIGPVIVVAGTLAGSLGTLAALFGTTLPLMMKAVLPFLGPAGLIAAGVIALGIIWLKWGDEIKAVISLVVGKIADWYNANLKPTFDAAGRVVTAFGDVFSAFGRLVGAIVMTALEPVLARIVPALRVVWDGFTAFADGASTAFKGMVDKVVGWITGPLIAGFDKVAQGLEKLTGFFDDMYMRVVGGSIVPDMVSGVVAEFTKMHGETVTRTEALRDSVIASFTALSSSTQISTREMVAEVAAQMIHMQEVTSAVNASIVSSHSATTAVLTEEGRLRAIAHREEEQSAARAKDQFIAMGGTLEKVSSESVKHAETMRGGIMGAFDSIVGSIGGAMGSLDGFLGKLGGVGSAISGLLGGSGGGILGKIGGVLSASIPGGSALTSLLKGDIGGAITGALTSLIPGGSIVRGIAGPLVGKAVGAVGGVAKKVGKKISGFFGFADGGLHGGGLRLVGERGPELEFTGPSRIFSTSKTKDILSSGAGGGNSVDLLSAQLRALEHNSAVERDGFKQVVARLERLVAGQDALQGAIRRGNETLVPA